MKSADFLFLIAAVFFASTEAQVDLAESWPVEILDSSRESGTTRQRLEILDQRNDRLNIYSRVQFQQNSQCIILPALLSNDSNENDTMHFLCETQLNWHMAEKYCKNLGMHLAVVDNEMIFSSLVHELSDYADQRGITSVGFWIGGTDLGNEGNWYWQSNGQYLIWQKWISQQPDNAGDNEHCLEIITFPEDDGLFSHSLPYAFNDEQCQTKHRFVCELN